MTKVRPVHANGFSRIFQHSHILPDGFLVAKGWPAVSTGFGQELFRRPTQRSDKQRFPGDRVIKCYGSIRRQDQIFKRSATVVPRLLGKVAIVVANAIGEFVRDTEP